MQNSYSRALEFNLIVSWADSIQNNYFQKSIRTLSPFAFADRLSQLLNFTVTVKNKWASHLSSSEDLPMFWMRTLILVRYRIKKSQNSVHAPNSSPSHFINPDSVVFRI